MGHFEDSSDETLDLSLIFIILFFWHLLCFLFRNRFDDKKFDNYIMMSTVSVFFVGVISYFIKVNELNDDTCRLGIDYQINLSHLTITVILLLIFNYLVRKIYNLKFLRRLQRKLNIFLKVFILLVFSVIIFIFFQLMAVGIQIGLAFLEGKIY